MLDSQFGFQKGKSTVDCIFTLFSIIAKTLDRGGGRNYIAYSSIMKRLLIKLIGHFFGKNLCLSK